MERRNQHENLGTIDRDRNSRRDHSAMGSEQLIQGKPAIDIRLPRTTPMAVCRRGKEYERKEHTVRTQP